MASISALIEVAPSYRRNLPLLGVIGMYWLFIIQRGPVYGCGAIAVDIELAPIGGSEAKVGLHTR
jgi:hypothetical protein